MPNIPISEIRGEGAADKARFPRGKRNLAGYLDPETGTRLRCVLDSIAAPVGDHDQRPVAQRRVQGLHALVSSVLDAGQLPSDKGLRPHLTVLVEHNTMKQAVTRHHTPDTATAAPPFLKGYGAAGRGLLAKLACDAALTVALTHTTDGAGRNPYRHVLDVGRT